MINVNFENLDKEISYIKIIAKANFDTTKEFLEYKSLTIKEEVDYKRINPSESLIELVYDGKKKNIKEKLKMLIKFKNIY